MTIRRTSASAALAATALLVIACGSGAAPSGVGPSSGPSAAPSSAGGSPSGSPSAGASSGPAVAPSGAPAALILKVTTEGGFINPVANLNALPIVEVYSDGRILTPGPVDAIAPGPLLAPVTVRTVGPSGASAIVAAIKAAGLDRASSAGPGVPGDSGTDIFSVVLDGETVTTRLSGNGPGGGRPGVPGSVGGGSDDPGRSGAFTLLDRLLDPTDTWGAPAGQPTTYQPLGYRVFVAPGAPAEDASTPRPPVTWPLASGLAAFGTPATPDRGIAGLRQGVVVGRDAAVLGPILEKGSQATPFESGGKEWTLYVRALLPDELGG
jgi:hypothetical protein